MDGSNVSFEVDAESRTGDDEYQLPIEEKDQAVMRKWSDVWNSYTFFYKVQKGVKKLYARCNICDFKDYPAGGRDGTGNPGKHLIACAKKLGKGAGRSAPFNLKTFCIMFAQAIICHAYPLRIVEHEYLRRLLTYLNPKVVHVTRNTILKVCIREHERCKLILLKSLCDDVAGRISFTCDLWTACTNRGFLTLTAHYVDKNWVLRSKILNFRYFPPPHRAGNIKSFVLNLIKDWKLEGKALSMTLDNASNMGNMVDLLKNDLHNISPLPCDGKFFHIRCCAHVLNLIVQSGLKCVDSSVDKLRNIIKHIDGSECRLKLFEDAIIVTNSDFSCKLLLDVPTRWNSTYLMLRRAILAKEPLIQFAASNMNHQDNLNEGEWKTVEKICDFLEPFFDITELFSGSKYPTANLYFMNIVLIEELIVKGHIEPQLKVMAEAMLRKFNAYWSEYSVILSVAVVLDPRYKLDLVIHMYDKLYCEEESRRKVNEVKQALNDLYSFYASLSSTNSHLPDPSSTISMLESPQPSKRAKILQSFTAKVAAARNTRSEIESYLSSPPPDSTPENDSDFDVLKFWQTQVETYPVLAVLARDILAIPVTSVASESSFSMGSRTLNKYRSALLPKNVEVLVTTQNWLQGYEETEDDVLEIGREIDNEPELEGLL